LRLGRLPALSTSKTSESVLISSIDLFIPLLAYLTLDRLLLANYVTQLSVVRRACSCGASRRSAAAEVDKSAEVSLFSFPLAFFLALVSALAYFAVSLYCYFCIIASVLSCWVTNFYYFSSSFCLCLSFYIRFLFSARWRFLISYYSFLNSLLTFPCHLRAYFIYF
jgi:hypothetical protein